MRTHLIIIICVTVISLGIGLFFILKKKSCPSGSSKARGVNSRSIGQRAQFTNIEEPFTKKILKNIIKINQKNVKSSVIQQTINVLIKMNIIDLKN